MPNLLLSLMRDLVLGFGSGIWFWNLISVWFWFGQSLIGFRWSEAEEWI